jgi:hypothetical protein
LKYKVSPMADVFKYDGRSYPSGSIVDLPEGVPVPGFLIPMEPKVKFATEVVEPKVEVALDEPKPYRRRKE